VEPESNLPSNPQNGREVRRLVFELLGLRSVNPLPLRGRISVLDIVAVQPYSRSLPPSTLRNRKVGEFVPWRDLPIVWQSIQVGKHHTGYVTVQSPPALGGYITVHLDPRKERDACNIFARGCLERREDRRNAYGNPWYRVHLVHAQKLRGKKYWDKV
jgi:hypothetical protein